MTPRDRILNRVRTALARGNDSHHAASAPDNDFPLFARPTGTQRELFTRFEVELAKLHGEALWMDSLQSAHTWFLEQGFGRVLAIDDSLVRKVLLDAPKVEWIATDCPSRAGWESADCGVSPVLGLSAESGSTLVAADLCGRAVSVLPPTHVALATPMQIVADLDALITMVRDRYQNRLPSTLSLISGPSRTADIEKILVLGAHGPRRLVVLVVAESETD